MNKKSIKIAEIGVAILGFVATIVSSKIAEAKMKDAVKEEVEKQMKTEE